MTVKERIDQIISSPAFIIYARAHETGKVTRFGPVHSQSAESACFALLRNTEYAYSIIDCVEA